MIFADLPSILSAMRSYIENLTEIPTYTEQMVDSLNPKTIVIFFDDANPWQGQEWKTRTMNIKIACRFSLSELGDDYLEINALDESYQLLCRLEAEKVPPGLQVYHYLTRCGVDDNGRYTVEMTVQTKSIN